MVMAAKLTRLTHKIAIQLHLVAESYISCSSRSRWPVGIFWIQPLTGATSTSVFTRYGQHLHASQVKMIGWLLLFNDVSTAEAVSVEVMLGRRWSWLFEGVVLVFVWKY